MMGELVAKYEGKKKLGICLRGERMLPALDKKCHGIVDKFFKDHGVTMHYKSPYSESFKSSNNYDLVIDCMGVKCNTDFMRKNFSQCISKSG